MNIIPSGHLVPKLRRINVVAKSSRGIDVKTMSFLLHYVPAGYNLEIRPSINTGEKEDTQTERHI